jgi:hexosaminidase
MEVLYKLLNEGAYFYMESFERRVWAWGNIGKTHLPDLPRWDAVEYNPYWNLEYAERVSRAKEYLEKMNQAISICAKNLAKKINNRYDVEVFQTIAQLIRHTALTYLDLSQLENVVAEAHENRFINLEETYKSLKKAEKIVEDQIERRRNVYSSLVAKWEETRLPKGTSTPSEKYFFEQDRTRHFANRVPDMSYLIVDEQLLGLEEYLVKLKAYLKFFRDKYLAGHD